MESCFETLLYFKCVSVYPERSSVGYLHMKGGKHLTDDESELVHLHPSHVTSPVSSVS
jgi:hypothetical protein